MFAAISFAAVSSSCRRETSPEGEAPPLHVAAAADLNFAFADIARDFTSATGRHVTLSFGASGLLAKQISNGAPFDLFASASPDFAESVVASGQCDRASQRVYAVGHLAVLARPGLTLPDRTLASLTAPGVTRIAIANPEHAPYGRAAKEALTNASLWDSLKPRIVFGENVQQTASFVETGNADVAVVALSLASHSSATDSLFEVPAPLYHPIAQTLVTCRPAGKQADPDAQRFADYVLSAPGQKILASHHFGPATADGVHAAP